MQRNVPSKSLQSCDVFLLAGGGGGYNFNFSLTLPRPFCWFVWFFAAGSGGEGGGSVVVGEVGRDREQNV